MKRCKKCLREFPLSDFYACASMADGRLNSCKACVCDRVRERYWRNHDKIAAYERERFNRPERKAKLAEYQRERRAREPQKNLARQRLTYAVRMGHIVKPANCPHCGSTDRIQAHHHDYSKPLDVTWACFKCHREKFHAQRCAA